MLPSQVSESALTPPAHELLKITSTDWCNSTKMVGIRLTDFARNCCDVGEQHFISGKSTVYLSHEVQIKNLIKLLGDENISVSVKEKAILQLPSNLYDYEFKLCGISKALNTLQVNERSIEFVENVTSALIKGGIKIYKDKVNNHCSSDIEYNLLAAKFGVKELPIDHADFEIIEGEQNDCSKFVLSRTSDQYICLRLSGQIISMINKDPKDKSALEQLEILTGNTQKLDSRINVRQLAHDIFKYIFPEKVGKTLSIGTCKNENGSESHIETDDYHQFWIRGDKDEKSQITLKEYQTCSTIHPHLEHSLLRAAISNTKELGVCIEFSLSNELHIHPVVSTNYLMVEQKMQCMRKIAALSKSDEFKGWLGEQDNSIKLRNVLKLLTTPTQQAQCLERLHELGCLKQNEKEILKPEVLVHMPNEVLQQALSENMKQKLLCAQCYQVNESDKAAVMHLGIAKKLMELDFDHNCGETSYMHPILIVCNNGCLDMLKVLYACDDTKFNKNPRGAHYKETGAMLATRSGHVDIIKFIFSKLDSQVQSQLDSMNHNVLHAAVMTDSTACLEYLLSQPSIDASKQSSQAENFLEFVNDNGTNNTKRLIFNSKLWVGDRGINKFRSKFDLRDAPIWEQMSYKGLTPKEASELSLYDKKRCLVEYINSEMLKELALC